MQGKPTLQDLVFKHLELNEKAENVVKEWLDLCKDREIWDMSSYVIRSRYPSNNCRDKSRISR